MGATPLTTSLGPLSMAHDDAPDAIKELADSKQPFVLRDYASYSEASSRNMTTITTIRSWQITAISGLIVLAKYLPGWLWAAALVIVWFTFLLLECNEQVFLERSNDEALKREKALSARTLTEFRTNIVNWEYGNQSMARMTTKQRTKRTFQMMVKQGILIWHVPATVLLVAALLARFVFDVLPISTR